MAKRLMDEAREAFPANHYSYRTEEQYLKWMRRFILFHDKRHPRVLGLMEGKHWLMASQYVFVRMNMCKRRHHIHPSSLSRAVKIAVDESGINKRATPQTFRHSFATHLLKRGGRAAKSPLDLG